MKWILWVLIFLAFAVPIVFIGKGIDNLDIMKDRYKRAVEAGADAAVKYSSYTNAEEITKTSIGYGEGDKDKYNIPINKDEVLFWFYQVFFRNIGIETDADKQAAIKKHIPMKAIAAFDRLMIADAEDYWMTDIFYDIEYLDKAYRFTLSEKILDLSTGEWKRDIDLGISPEKRKQLVCSFIKERINVFLNNRDNFESQLYYDVKISVSDEDTKSEDISGINFMVLIEGLPLPSMNPWKPNSFYAFSISGSELNR